ncbi:MAG: excinuclease ABC subunit UvrA [Bacteriovoracia bacterium]
MADLETTIIIRGAREHNLKNIDLDLPKNSLVVITGLSGSGKSSLAFDTIYAEGQRRYVESLSAYARQFLEQMTKPDVDSLEGLAPSVSIEQRTTSHNPRSTVGTVTEIYDYMRVLWAKVSKPGAEGAESFSHSQEQIIDKVMALESGARIQILAPIVVSRKGEHSKEIEAARKSGFSKIRVNKATFDIFDELPIDKKKNNSISIIIDRFLVKPENRPRIAKAVELSLKMAKGAVAIESVVEGETKTLTFSTGIADPTTGLSLPNPEPRLFSFNSPVGACPNCNGLGYLYEFDPDLIINDPNLSLAAGALANWTGKPLPGKPSYEEQTLEALSKHYKFDLAKPFRALSEKIKSLIFYGTGKEEINFSYQGKQSKYKTKRAFEGVIKDLERKQKNSGEDEQAQFDQFIARTACEDCHGNRLKPESLAFKIRGKSIADSARLPLRECLAFFESLTLKGNDAVVAEVLLREIRSRIGFLIDVGLDYLDISRSTNTLSGGETQRVRLATQIGASLVGVLYVLDEPSIGLHQRDNAKLIESLKELRDRGNSVIVVEHDRDTIEQADYVVDMGPGAGKLGGEIVARGTPADIMKVKASPTGRYLRGYDQIPVPTERRKPDPKRMLEIKGCTGNNLKDVDAKFPLGALICVSGVSGSGKSTLIFDTLVPVLRQKINHSGAQASPYREITGTELLDKVVHVDQSPIGRSPRSNPATYSGVFTQIRTLFAQTVDAQVRGYDIGRFSFNVKGGRCDTCEGDGAIKVVMHFLPDVYVPCHVCGGKRYNRETLAVKYKGKNIADVLAMTIEEAVIFFENVPTIEKFLRILHDVGLGYVTLGQSATTLSGGEAQRMKLSRELSKRPTGRTLYILDEPSTGLHFQDIQQLLLVIHRIVDQGNTVLVIEHNLDILKHADYLIDLGPEGGAGGGKIIAAGTPEEVVKAGKGHTAHFLAPYLNLKPGVKEKELRPQI